MKEPLLYKKDQIVKYKASFLRNTGWLIEVPIDGLVVEDQQTPEGIVCVQWCDSEEVVGVHPGNILLSGIPDHS